MAFSTQTSDISTMKNQCEATFLIKNMNFPREKRCSKNATCIHDGKHYCGIHDPNRKAERQEKSDAKKEKTRIAKSNLYIAYLYAKQRSK